MGATITITTDKHITLPLTHAYRITGNILVIGSV